uniref:C2H2-type domain-containing protein n=1 Tax=Bos indicus x Bos taurus TaxID=30522 RepID=A0A4W2EE92_BOBOX
MEIPRLLPARGMRQTGGAGSPEGGGRIRGGANLRAGQAPARRLLLLRGPQDGGPGRRREEASAASSCPGPGPSPLALRPDHATGCGSGCGSGGDDFFLVLLDPVGGDVETAGAGQAAGPVWREEAGLGPRLLGAKAARTPRLPPDLLLAERAEPAPAPAPKEEEEGPAAVESPRGPPGPGQGVLLYLCPEVQCGQTFAKKHQLKVHLLTHSSSQGQRPFKCPLGGCGWTFTTSYKLKRHLQSHDKLRPFGCPAEGCGKSFTTVYNLKAHMKGHEQENSFKCELSAHQRSHFEPERPYQCAFSGCKKTFITVSALFSHNRYDKACRLKIHLRSHTGERPFLCDFEGCGWNFTSMSKLLRHKRKHDDDRRFMCPVEGCGKSFTRAEHLKGHSITHLGTKPFVCPVEGCCARFSARSSLYIHSKKHLQDVDTWKSRCPVATCNKLFTSKHSMKTHMAKRHNLRQDLLAQLEAANSLTPSSELTSQGQSDLSDAELVSLFSDVPGNNSSAAVLDTALVNSGILTIDVASVNSTLAGNLPANNNNSLGQAVDPQALMATSDLPQSLDTSLFFGTTAAGFQQGPLDMDDVSSLSAGPLASLSSLALKNSSQEPQALIPSSKLTVDTDALTPSSTLCENSVSELLPPTKTEWNVHPDSDFFAQEEETQFGFSNPAGNHGSQKETDLITVTGSSFLV